MSTFVWPEPYYVSSQQFHAEQRAAAVIALARRAQARVDAVTQRYDLTFEEQAERRTRAQAEARAREVAEIMARAQGCS